MKMETTRDANDKAAFCAWPAGRKIPLRHQTEKIAN